jgi:hypothetical protein
MDKREVALRSLAARYRARAETADPDIAPLLRQIADEFEVEAFKASEGE